MPAVGRRRSQNSTFFTTRMTRYYTIQFGFGMRAPPAKTPIYPVTCRFPLFVALYVIASYQRYRQTDG